METRLLKVRLAVRRAHLSPSSKVTHAVPLKHLSPQPHILTGWLYSGAQPHAPMAQEFGKSPALSQQFAVVTVPPDAMQPSSAADGDGLTEGALVGAADGVAVGAGFGVTQPNSRTEAASSRSAAFKQSPITERDAA